MGGVPPSNRLGGSRKVAEPRVASRTIPPPRMSGSVSASRSGVPQSTPIPVGPSALCAEKATKSQPRACTSSLRCGTLCAECGTSLIKPISCPTCGTANEPEAKFCDACGHALKEAKAPPPTQDPRSYTPTHLAKKILGSRAALEGEHKQEMSWVLEAGVLKVTNPQAQVTLSFKRSPR